MRSPEYTNQGGQIETGVQSHALVSVVTGGRTFDVPVSPVHKSISSTEGQLKTVMADAIREGYRNQYPLNTGIRRTAGAARFEVTQTRGGTDPVTTIATLANDISMGLSTHVAFPTSMNKERLTTLAKQGERSRATSLDTKTVADLANIGIQLLLFDKQHRIQSLETVESTDESQERRRRTGYTIPEDMRGSIGQLLGLYAEQVNFDTRMAQDASSFKR